MRWVFCSLLVVNLVFLGWHLFEGALAGSARPAEEASASGQGAVASAGADARATSTPAREGVATLLLFSEAPQPRRTPSSASTVAPAPARCRVIGPWDSADEAERGRIQLAAAGVQAEVEAVAVRQDALNWVYLPPFPTRDKALAVLGDLQARGVDSFVVQDGEYANAISLGYFSNADSAEGIRVKMREAGFSAFVDRVSRSVTEYWLYLPQQEADPPALQDFLVGNPGVQRDVAACRTSAGHLPESEAMKL